MNKGKFITSRVNAKLVYGFIFIAFLILVTGVFSYSNLMRTRDSFRALDGLVSNQIIKIEEIRSSYSLMLLEMTTYLLIDFQGEDEKQQVNLINDNKNKLLQLLDNFLPSPSNAHYYSELKEAGEKSADLLGQIVEMRKEHRPLADILVLKRELKKVESENFFPVIDKMLDKNREDISLERTTVENITGRSLLLLIIIFIVIFILSIGVGAILSYREKLVDEFRDQLVSIASHQLKAPMTVIKGNLTLLEDTSLNDQQKILLQSLQEGSGILLSVVDNLLDLSRIDQGRFKLEPKKVSLITLLEKVIEKNSPIAQKSKIRVNFTKPMEDYIIFVDEFRFSQVLENIIDNAVKYSRDGGEVMINIIEHGQELIVRIQDAGIGIPVKDQKNIFGRFVRGSNTAGLKGGTGLGLFIVKNIIEGSGGSVRFESKQDKGTIFFVTIPRYHGSSTR